MKVAIRYSDGEYSMYEPTGNFAPGMTEADKAKWNAENLVEIPIEVWHSYQAFCEEANTWYARIRDLDNELWRKKLG